MSGGVGRILVVAVMGAVALLMIPAISSRAATVPSLSSAQSHYLEDCGGCHGVEGRSLNERVPDLAGRAGLFLCTTQGRDYLVQLPNVAFANLDAKALAAVMNFVVFGLGRGSAPAGARPYTAAEVARLRVRPIDSAGLIGLRAGIVGNIVRRCPKAVDLNAYGGGL